MLKFFEKIPSVAYVAGFIGCAVVSYVFYPQSKSKKHLATLKGFPRGLINCKNECFINVILQSLAASQKVTKWLLINKSSTVSSNSLFDTIASIVIRINRLDLQLNSINSVRDHNDAKNAKSDDLIHLDEDQEEFYAAQSFKSALSAHNWLIQSEEHDCHELFHLIMDVLDEEMAESKKSLTSFNYLTASRLKDSSRFKAKNPFHGYLAIQLQCLDCNYKYPLRLESFYSLSLILSQQKPTLNGITLVECINNYFKPEHITGMKCENCSKLNENNKIKKVESKGFIKKQAIAKLPETLALQIQRNSWSDQNFEVIKQTNYVQFPLKIKIDNTCKPQLLTTCQRQQNSNYLSVLGNKADLNSSFSLKQVGLGGLLGGNKNAKSNQNQPVKIINSQEVDANNLTGASIQQYYDLRSAVVHYGSAHSGHFVCYRKPLSKNFPETNSNESSSNSTNSDDWLQISDNDIKVCKQYHLLSSNVYMLFYDKVMSN